MYTIIKDGWLKTQVDNVDIDYSLGRPVVLFFARTEDMTMHTKSS